jgi:hypothetical protein
MRGAGMSLERWMFAEAECVPLSRRQYEHRRYARRCRSAGVDGRITHGRQSSEHERPDRVRWTGLQRGTAARYCQSCCPSRGRESDWFIVPVKPSKVTRRVEGRDQPEGSLREEARVRTQSRVALPPTLERVNAAASQAAQTRFTALLHHIDEAALHRAFRRQKRLASAGVDGMTVAKYEEGLTDNLRDLRERVHTDRYRPQPVRAGLHSQSRWR